MVSHKIPLLILLSLLFKIHSCVDTKCGKCIEETIAASQSESRFSTCTENEITGDLVTCPQGYSCSTSIITVCSPNQSPGCHECNQGYACISETAYANCTDSGYMNLLDIKQCDEGSVCVWPNDLGSGDPCIYSEDTKIIPTCSDSKVEITTTTTTGIKTTTTEFTTVNIETKPITTTTAKVETEPTTPIATTSTARSSTQSTSTTTTTGVVGDFDAFCAEIKQNVFTANIFDETCKTYVKCLQQSGKWIGIEYKCMGTQYWNGNYCSSKKPDHCK